MSDAPRPRWIAHDGAASGDDPVNPPHYKRHPSGVECITIARHLNFNRGNALKYLWRAGEKGEAVEDLEKARWYLDDEIARLKAERGGGEGGRG